MISVVTCPYRPGPRWLGRSPSAAPPRGSEFSCRDPARQRPLVPLSRRVKPVTGTLTFTIAMPLACVGRRTGRREQAGTRRSRAGALWRPRQCPGEPGGGDLCGRHGSRAAQAGSLRAGSPGTHGTAPRGIVTRGPRDPPGRSRGAAALPAVRAISHVGLTGDRSSGASVMSAHRLSVGRIPLSGGPRPDSRGVRRVSRAS